MARRKSSAAVQQTRADLSSARGAAGVEMDDAAYRKSLARELDKLELRSAADLNRVGLKVQNEARKLAPVDTGRLRSSIMMTPGEDAKGPFVDIGTNVVYAPMVEFGTAHSAAQPFMRPALLLAARWWKEAIA